MAQYTLKHKDGTVYKINGPEGASKEDLVSVLAQKQQPRDSRSSRLEELLASQAQYDPTSRDSTLGEEFMRTLRSTLSSGRTGIASLLGDEEAQARAGLERAEAIGQDYGAAPSFEQVKETYGEEGLLAAVAEGAFSPSEILHA
jgi:ATPase subunit of ABC transporter with duplicated ATPase domains